jgi:hypothetical protein
MQFISSRLEETPLNRSKGYSFKFKLVVWIFVVPSIYLLAAGVIWHINTLLFLAKAKSVKGTVIEVVPIPKGRPQRDAVFCVTKVVFREETTKVRLEFTPHSGFSLTNYNEDERITVFYDPENPKNAKIGDFEELFLYGTIFFLLGAFLFLCGWLLVRKDVK